MVSLTNRLIGSIWSKYHITPLQMARCVGPFLPSIIRSFVRNSTLFRTVTDEEQISALSQYLYGLVRSRSSADILMCHIVGEWTVPTAKRSGLRIKTLVAGPAGQSATPSPFSLSELAQALPTHVFRGEDDWVTRLSSEQAGWVHTDVAGVGHSLHVERPEITCAALASCLASET